jgi:hypothetical protein
MSCVFGRFDGGEICAAIGIEGNSEMGAEAPEFCWIERHSDSFRTTTADLLFSLFSALKPMGILLRQKVAVFHHGLDFVVLLKAIPALRNAHFLIHDAPLLTDRCEK